MPRWIQDRKTGKLIPADQRALELSAPAVHGDIEPFVSPIDQRVIGSRAELRRHNEEHGVVQHREYGENEGTEYFERSRRERDHRLQGQTRRDREERIDALRHAWDLHRSRR